jgi:glycosyltransferase 2 family protein
MEPAHATSSPRRGHLRLLRIALLIVPLAWLSHIVRPREVLAHMSAIAPRIVLFAWLAAFASTLFGVARWRWLLAGYGVTKPPPYRTLLRHTLVGLFFNILPGGIAGDAVRAYRVRASVPNLTMSYAIVVVERLCGLAAILLINAAALSLGVPFAREIVRSALYAAAVFGLVLATLVLLTPSVLARSAGLRDRVGRIPLIGRIVVALPPAPSPGRLIGAVALSIATQGCAIVAVSTVVRAFATVSLADCLRIVPLCIILTVVPITPGAIGQREGVFVYLLGLLGVAASAAVATSVLVFTLVLMTAMLGGLVYLFESAS